VALLACVPMAVPPAAAAAAAATTAAGQLRWLVDASRRAPVSAGEQAEHLSLTFLAGVGGTQGFNDVLVGLGPLAVQRSVVESPGYVEAIVRYVGGTLTTVLQVDGTGLVVGLQLVPYRPDPRSWAEVDAALRELAPQASFVSAVIRPDGRCRTVHGLAEDTQRPLGSAFKLYVLGALGRAVARERAAWTQPLAIRDGWKSLPSGVLQDSPAGTVLPLRRYAELMISISDNTATDHLIHRLGRDAVQAQFVRFGHRRPAANVPLLTTRNFFTLKGVRYPVAADAYLRLPRVLRAATLPALDRVPRSRISSWTQPRRVDELEWYGSPTDICRAFAGLARQAADPALAPVDDVLSINDGALGLDRSRYPTVWFKGGSEPGVQTLNYLARTATGQTVVSSVMLADTGRALDDPFLDVRARAVARAGIHLATGG
jgi:hypothetical protein